MAEFPLGGPMFLCWRSELIWGYPADAVAFDVINFPRKVLVRQCAPAALAAFVIAAACSQGLSYWPGIMTWDAINQYGQAVSGTFDDWHPPAMAWLWRQLTALRAGPAPMYLLQLVLYWLGYGLILAGALRGGRGLAAVIVSGCALMPFPLAIMGSVLKDCLMQGLLLIAVGLFVWSGPERSWASRLAAMLLLVLAGLLRFNAFLATLPLLVALTPAGWRHGPLRMTAVAAISLAGVLLALPVANRLIGADRSNVELSLVMFDLGGITKHAGVDMFPPVGVSDPVAINARCYRPDKWDSYSSWGHPPCPISFERVDALMTENGAAPYTMWVRAVLSHPLAYAEHRLEHFNINTRFLVPDEVQGAAPYQAIENEWHYTVSNNPGLRFIHRFAEASIHSPLGWPIWWMAVAAGFLALCPYLPSRWLIAPVALSSLLYGMGYLVFSVSSELRYHLWTITGTGIAAAFALADVAESRAVSRRMLIASLAPAFLVGILCSIWRLS
jgi:hypothetical protein